MVLLHPFTPCAHPDSPPQRLCRPAAGHSPPPPLFPPLACAKPLDFSGYAPAGLRALSAALSALFPGCSFRLLPGDRLSLRARAVRCTELPLAPVPAARSPHPPVPLAPRSLACHRSLRLPRPGRACFQPPRHTGCVRLSRRLALRSRAPVPAGQEKLGERRLIGLDYTIQLQFEDNKQHI